VRSDETALASAQRGALVDDVEQSGVDLADVMKERDALEAPAGVVVEVGGTSQDQRVRGDAPHVGAGGMIVRVDGVEQRFQRRGGESFAATDLATTAENDGGAGSQAGEQSGAHARRERRKRTFKR
jgi:hypothetical protein